MSKVKFEAVVKSCFKGVPQAAQRKHCSDEFSPIVKHGKNGEIILIERRKTKNSFTYVSLTRVVS